MAESGQSATVDSEGWGTRSRRQGQQQLRAGHDSSTLAGASADWIRGQVVGGGPFCQGLSEATSKVFGTDGRDR